MKIYCEPGALSPEVKALQNEGLVELVYFPYDPTTARRIAPSAVPSDAQWRDVNLTWDELGATTWDDFGTSLLFPEVRRIIGGANRRDILHVDSAFKTGCAAFVTADRDILDHREELRTLLGIRFFHPECDSATLRAFVLAHL